MNKNVVLALSATLLTVSSVAAQQTVNAPPGTPINITVSPAAAAGPPVSITLGARHGHVTPHRCGCCNHTGGGNIGVAQPSPDTIIITMAGVAVACPHPFKNSSSAMDFDLNQEFAVVFDDPKLKAAKLSAEARVIGLLRSGAHNCHTTGSAGFDAACVNVGGPAQFALALCVPPHDVCGGQNLGVNCAEGPQCIPVVPGCYTLHQSFRIWANHPCAVGCCKAASAEFAPEPALDPLWISHCEPFHGANKSDFGFQVVIRVTPVEAP